MDDTATMAAISCATQLTGGAGDSPPARRVVRCVSRQGPRSVDGTDRGKHRVVEHSSPLQFDDIAMIREECRRGFELAATTFDGRCQS